MSCDWWDDRERRLWVIFIGVYVLIAVILILLHLIFQGGYRSQSRVPDDPLDMVAEGGF